ncbi:50S ribosomal protein L13 [Nanoarchaeota archaeon]|nr:MAG: 50S ribosomal protein L13 [Nanoarchaeota archaeon]
MVEIIDATNTVAGRLASWVAKRALEGKQVVIVNAEKAIVTGNKEYILEFFRQRRERGEPFHGPFYPKRADRILRRMIRGMLPYKKERGRKALGRVKVYIGEPEQFKGKGRRLEGFGIEKLKVNKYMTLGEISKHLGGKI